MLQNADTKYFQGGLWILKKNFGNPTGTHFTSVQRCSSSKLGKLWPSCSKFALQQHTPHKQIKRQLAVPLILIKMTNVQLKWKTQLSLWPSNEYKVLTIETLCTITTNSALILRDMTIVSNQIWLNYKVSTEHQCTAHYSLNDSEDAEFIVVWVHRWWQFFNAVLVSVFPVQAFQASFTDVCSRSTSWLQSSSLLDLDFP